MKRYTSKLTTKVKYIVFDGGVKAIITIQTLPKNILEMRNFVYANPYQFPSEIGNYIPDSVTGIARLKDGDKFDVELGKTIARKKAMRKLYAELYNFERAFLEELENKVEKYTDDAASLYLKKITLTREIKGLANS